MKESTMGFDKWSAKNPWLLGHSLTHRLHNDSLLLNSLYIMISTVATAVIGYLYWVVAAHTYIAYDIGLASALISIMTLTAVLADLGVSSTLVQILPRRESDTAWSLALNAGFVTGTLTSLLAAIIMVVVLPFFSHQFVILWHDAGFTLVFVLGVSLVTITTLLDQTFVAERKSGHLLMRNVTFALIKLILLVLFVQIGASGIFSSWVLALAITLILGGFLLITRLKRAYCLTLHGLMRQLRSMFSSLMGHHFINTGGKASMYLLPVLVTVRLTATDNAYYYAASMVGTFFFMVSASVAVSLFAEGSHAEDDLLHKARFSAIVIGMLLAPAMLISFLGGRYILLVFGPSYVQHALFLLMILTIAAVPDAITNIYVSILRVQKRLRRAGLLNLGMALLSLTLAWILLPKLGIVGAGWAFLIAQAVGSLIAGTDIVYHQLRWTGVQAQQHDLSRPIYDYDTQTSLPSPRYNSGRPIYDYDTQTSLPSPRYNSGRPIYDYDTQTSLPSPSAWSWLVNLSRQGVQETISNIDNPIQQISHAEAELSPDDTMATFDVLTQTEPQMEVSSCRNHVDHGKIDTSRSIERWLERWKPYTLSSSVVSQKPPEWNTDE